MRHIENAMNLKTLPMLVAALTSLSASCSSIPTRRAEAGAIVRHNKAEFSSEFIGIAGGKAFKLVRLITLFGGNPREVIWWCPVSELTPAEMATLRAGAELE